MFLPTFETTALSLYCPDIGNDVLKYRHSKNRAYNSVWPNPVLLFLRLSRSSHIILSEALDGTKIVIVPNLNGLITWIDFCILLFAIASVRNNCIIFFKKIFFLKIYPLHGGVLLHLLLIFFIFKVLILFLLSILFLFKIRKIKIKIYSKWFELKDEIWFSEFLTNYHH